MAKRDGRQTKRERKAQAKQRRLEEMRRRARRQRMRRVYTIVALAAIVGGIIAIVTLAGRGGREATRRLNDLAAAAGCGELESPALEGRDHISPPTQARYRTNPPASGPHYNAAGQGPVATGIHDAPLQEEGYIHNLEHGHVGMFYTDQLNAEVLGALREVVGDEPRWTLLAPRPENDVPLALVAWGRLIKCETPGDAGAVAEAAREFVEQHRDKAPESVPGIAVGVTPSPDATAPPTAIPSPTATATPRRPSPTPTRS